MYTEIKEFCNFFVRYLRYRMSCASLMDFIEHLGNWLVVEFHKTWLEKNGNDKHTVHTLRWFSTTSVHDCFKYAANKSSVDLKLLYTLLPDRVIYCLSPGLVSYNRDGAFLPTPIWEGEFDEDDVYEEKPLCALIVSEPPLVTVCKDQRGGSMTGTPVLGESDLKETPPAYLTDPMMIEAHIPMALRSPYSNEFGRNFNNLLFKTDISRRKGCPNLMSVAEFHDTKFGSFRSAVASASDEDVDDEDAA